MQVLPPNVRVLANGAVYDLDKGRIVANPGGGTHAITSENARALIHKRWADYHAAAEDGVALGTKRDTSVLGWGYIVERQSELAVDIKQGRSSTEAARFVRDSLGLSQDHDAGGASIRLDVSGEALELLLQAVLAWRDGG